MLVMERVVLAETKEAISPPSGTTAFPRRSINVTRVKENRSEEEGRRERREGKRSRYINTVGDGGNWEAFSKLKVNVVYKRFRRGINS